MTEISHFLRPGGWKITRTEGVCSTMLPEDGMILIGRAGAKDEFWLVWVDGSGRFQVVKDLQQQAGSPEWRGTFKKDGHEYGISVKPKGKGIKVVKKIKGEIWAFGGHSNTGTWGAEAGGGGGGGGNTPPPTKSRANGSGVNAAS